MKKRSFHKILALLLTFVLVMGYNVSAEQFRYDETELQNEVNFELETEVSVLSAEDIPEFISDDLIADSDYVARLYEKEDFDTVIFENEDGSETAHIFNEVVKYVNENGEIADKSNRLFSVPKADYNSKKYAYVNLENDILTYFPRELNQDTGVLLMHNGMQIELAPINKNVAKVDNRANEYRSFTDNWVYYDGVFGKNTAIRYAPMFNGFKEDIVLYENVGNIFNFSIKTNGLTAKLTEGGSIALSDGKDIIAGISPIFVYDSNDNSTYENHMELSQIADSEYEIVVIVDETFLSCEKTVYPVYVDPTAFFYANRPNNIEGKPITDGVPTSQQHFQNATLGHTAATGTESRYYMRFPRLMDSNFMSDGSVITGASLRLFENSGLSATSTISVHRYTGTTNFVNIVGHTTAVWNGININTPITSTVLNQGSNREYMFNITSEVNFWKSNPQAAIDKGIVVRNNSTTSANRKTVQAVAAGTLYPSLLVSYVEVANNGLHYVKNHSTKGYINNTLQQNTAKNFSTQIWRFTHHSDDLFIIQPTSASHYNANTGTYTHVLNCDSSGNLSIISRPSTITNNQLFRLTQYTAYAPIYTYQIQSASSHRLLTVANGNNNLPITTVPWSTAINTHWEFEKLGAFISRNNNNGPNIPNNIGNTFGTNPATTRIITWQTGTNANNQVELGDVMLTPSQGTTINYTRTLGEFVNGIPTRTYHRAVITGLVANTLYSFNCGNNNPTGGRSPTYTFKTAPSTMPSNGFTILHVTDPQIGNRDVGSNNTTEANIETAQAWQRTIDAGILRMEINSTPPAFIVNTGDVINNGYSTGNLDRLNYYFDYAQETIASNAFVYSLGNNDSVTWYNQHFASSGDIYHTCSNPQTCTNTTTCPPHNYSFVYGNTLFVNVHFEENNLTATNLTWLESQLGRKNNNTIRWTVVMMHHSPFGRSAPGSGSGTNATRQRAFAGLFDQYNVDLVLAGHNHFYARTYHIDRFGQNKTNGTVYSIPNTAGNKFNPISTVSERRRVDNNYQPINGTSFLVHNGSDNRGNRQPEKQMFSTIRFTSTNVYVLAYVVEANGSSTLYDSFSLR
jgi:hypothetical protein